MNKVVLIGRLTRDPELRYTSSNVATASFSLAVNRPFQNQNGVREADFINIVVWRKPAETAKKYLTKGSLIAVEGRIQTRNWEDEQGQKHYVTEGIAEEVDFADSKKEENSQDGFNVDDNNPLPFSDDLPF